MNMILCSYVKFVYFLSPLLGNQPHGSDLPSPNLRPRHQELILTPCGPVRYWRCRAGKWSTCFHSCRALIVIFFVVVVAITGCFTFFVLSMLLQIKRWSELPRLLQVYFCFAILSLLALLGLTVSSLYKQHTDTDVSDEDNFTVSLIQLVGIGEFVEGKKKKDICSIHHHPHRLLLKSRSSSVAIIWWKLQWKEPVPVAYVFSEDLCQLS